MASFTTVYALPIGRLATVENSDTAMRDPVFLRAAVNARNAVFTFSVAPADAMEPDSSRITWMSIPQDATRFGFATGTWASPGAATASLVTLPPTTRATGTATSATAVHSVKRARI